MSYFVDILSGVRYIFLPVYLQIFFPVKLRFRVFLNYIKVQSKKRNYHINSTDKML